MNKLFQTFVIVLLSLIFSLQAAVSFVELQGTPTKDTKYDYMIEKIDDAECANTSRGYIACIEEHANEGWRLHSVIIGGFVLYERAR